MFVADTPYLADTGLMHTKRKRKIIRKAKKRSSRKAPEKLPKDYIGFLLKKNQQGIKIDLGCGAAKQPGFVGLDNRPLPGVDIVQDLELFPWALPDECASLVMSSHLMEHIDPHSPDARIAPLIKLLLKKKLVTPKEIAATVGEIEPGPLFMRFLDEIWRVLKPGGQYMASMPYATSAGFYQDPTHINHINEHTFAYFDPIAGGGVLYNIYKPKPWAISSCSFSVNGNMEVLLTKRKIDKSYL